jgi:hypothetical protein
MGVSVLPKCERTDRSSIGRRPLRFKRRRKAGARRVRVRIVGGFVKRARSASDGCLRPHRANTPRWSRTNRPATCCAAVTPTSAIGAGGPG